MPSPFRFIEPIRQLSVVGDDRRLDQPEGSPRSPDCIQ